jgi:hypothetical protein
MPEDPEIVVDLYPGRNFQNFRTNFSVVGFLHFAEITFLETSGTYLDVLNFLKQNVTTR